MNKTLDEIWKKLAVSTDSQDGIRRLRLDPDHLKIYAGWNISQNRPALILEVKVATLPGNVEYPQSFGFELLIMPLKSGRNGIVRIILLAKEEQFNDIFPVLVQDVYENIKGAENENVLVQCLITRLCRWQVFLKRHRHSRLSESQQIGLWGELWFLWSRMIPFLGSITAVNSWRGPDRSNQDFEFNGTAVEVKTTTTSPHEKIHVSNVHQLEVGGLDNLFLYHIAIVMHQGSGQTIPELVRSIRENLENSPRALEVFNEKLFQTGYLDSEATWYERIGFHTLNQVAYHVEDGFPRISMETIPEGVGDLKYSLVLSTCSDFKVIPDPFTK